MDNFQGMWRSMSGPEFCMSPRLRSQHIPHWREGQSVSLGRAGGNCTGFRSEQHIGPEKSQDFPVSWAPWLTLDTSGRTLLLLSAQVCLDCVAVVSLFVVGEERKAKALSRSMCLFLPCAKALCSPGMHRKERSALPEHVPLDSTKQISKSSLLFALLLTLQGSRKVIKPHGITWKLCLSLT